MSSGALLWASLTDELERVAAVDAERGEELPSFREFLEGPDFAGPYMAKVGISPVIGAIVDASEGNPVDGLTDEEALEVFRLHLDELPLVDAPRVVVVNAGRQSGKTSNMLAPKCVHAAWTQAAPFLRPGQVARCAIISPTTELSRAAFRYCRGVVLSSPRLTRNVVKMSDGNLRNVTDEQILLRRPDGHQVEIVVGSADAGGSAARSNTLLFCGLDEAAFFRDDSAVVNDAGIFDAAMGTIRMLDGAQIWIVSTPWIEGSGKMEELITEHWGKVSSVLVAARVSSYAMRGIPDNSQLREDTDTAETYDREVLARPLAAGAAGFFSPLALARALLRTPPEGPPQELGAGGDFAFESDCAAAGAMGRWLGGLFGPTLVEERHATPKNPEAASQTVRELGALLLAAGCSRVFVDSWKIPFVREHLHAEGVAAVQAPGSDEGNAETWGAFKRIVDEDRLCLGHLEPKVAQYIVSQLRAVISMPMSGPGKRFKISQPRTKRTLEGKGAGKIGAHGDIASALVLAAWMAGGGRAAAGWQIPKQNAAPAAATRGASRAPLGGSASSAFLRARSASVGFGRGPVRREDD